MCAYVLDTDMELDKLFSLVELDEREEGEILSAVRSSTEEPLRGSDLGTDEEGSHEERCSERSPCQGPKLINTPTGVINYTHCMCIAIGCTLLHLSIPSAWKIHLAKYHI